jgi:hypothetical protein
VTPVRALALAGGVVVAGGIARADTLPALTAEEIAVRDRLRAHVHALAIGIGERNSRNPGSLGRTRDYVVDRMRDSGYRPSVLPFEHGGETFHNVEVVLAGTVSDASLVVGAHYDSVAASPGANDNASGVAVLLELARSLRASTPSRAVRFVAFPNEEPPYFDTGDGMGSVAYVRSLADPRSVRAMLSIETVGYYSDAAGSQRYPPAVGWFYPDRGNFVAFVGNLGSRRLVRRAADAFRASTSLPAEHAALPAFVPGVSWSDHRSFWAAGVPALMVTDTALFRDPHYHRASDTAERLDYDRMARLVTGLVGVVTALASD